MGFFSRIFTFIGSMKYGKGQMDDAIKWFDRAYSLPNPKPKTVVSYAYLLLKSGNVTKSEDLLRRLIQSKIKPDEMMLAKSNYALVLWKQGNVDGAVKLLEKVFENYKNTAVYGSLGFLLILNGDIDKALKFNLEAYEYNSENKIIQDNLGQTYYVKGDYEKAREVFEKLISTSPTFPEPYYNYGLVLNALGNKTEAIEQMNKALSFSFTFLSSVTKEEIERSILSIS